MIEVGDKAPDFTLPDHRGQPVSLSDLRGERILLVIYPQDFSPACRDQLSVYQESLEQIEARGVKLVGVSVDSSWVHNAFRKSLGLEMPLLADFHPKGEMLRSFGAYLEDWGMANRSLVLIDADGVVRWVHECATPREFPPPDEILAALDALEA